MSPGLPRVRGARDGPEQKFTLAARPALQSRLGPPRDPTKARLLRMYAALGAHFGPQRGWRGHTAFEMAAGAVLTQRTAWRSVEGVLAVLRRQGLLTPPRLAALSEAELAGYIRSARTQRSARTHRGSPRTHRVTAKRLLALVRLLRDRFGGRFTALRRLPLAVVRPALLAVRGLGPEIADSILLHAAGRPVFVVDAYTRRIFGRHRLIRATGSYESIRAFIEAHLPSDPQLFNEYHALLAAVGKRYCRRVPLCGECPLRPDLGGRPPRAV